MATNAPPTIDFSASFDDEHTAKQDLVHRVRQACLQHGFFQIVNHGIPPEVTTGILSCAEELFSLPTEIKEKYDKDKGDFHRGYERLRSQNFEKRGQGDLKEGYYFGPDLPLDDPNVVARKFGQGPNLYPTDVQNPTAFRETVDRYHAALSKLAEHILNILAQSLNLDPGCFSGFVEKPVVATLRLLHYPPQPVDASELERGVGAHTDFGALTILLQDEVGGLQVWSRDANQWIDVVPTPGAFVVNLGNMMMRWTNDKYLSNLHRVINKSGRERYSVPFFFSGNPDFVVECLPSCVDGGAGAKYPPVSVGDWMTGRYADTYGTKGEKGMPELSVTEATKGII